MTYQPPRCKEWQNKMKINPKFEEYFLKIYQGRWKSIRAALSEKNKQIERPNAFHSVHLPLSLSYTMDPASEIVARCLQAGPADRVLDMCSAPGGKALIIAEQMSFGDNKLSIRPSGELICNEMSEGRRVRLVRVLNEYIDKERRLFIFVKGLDGNQYGLRQPDYFDRVLADVPCSAERHLLENLSELELWTEKRTKNLAIRQFSLLSSAWLSVKQGGTIVYSTCSLSPLENDAVVLKLVKKRGVKILRPQFLEEYNFLEETEVGYQILPDTCGYGPMYFSVLEK